MTGSLTTTANVKSFLNITTSTDDALVARLVTAASAFILAWLNRDLFSNSYTEVRDGTGTSFLTLRQFPIISVQSVLVNNVAVPLAPNSVSYGYGFDDKRLWLTGATWSRGVRNVTVQYTAGLASTGQTQQVTAERAVVPLTGPYTITSAQAQTFDTDLGVIFAPAGAALVEVSGVPTTGQYAINDATGVYTFAAADAGKAVALTYLYFWAVPLPVEQACIELVAAKYKLRTRVGVTSQTIGPEHITYSVKDIPPEVRGLLQQYRQVVPV